MRKLYLMFLLILIVSLISFGCSKTQTNDLQGNTNVENTEPAVEESQKSEDENTNESDEISFMDLIIGEEKVNSYSYEMELKSNDQVVGSYKLVTNKVRTLYEVPSDFQTIYFFNDEMSMYIYDTSTKVATKLPMQDGYMEYSTPFTILADIEDSEMNEFSYEGKEEFDSKTCLVYKYSIGDFSTTYYVWEDMGVILKAMMETPGEPSLEYSFKNLSFNENYDDLLTLPKDAQIQDFMNPQ